MMEGEGGAQSAGGRSQGDGNRRLVYSISTDVSVTRYPHTGLGTISFYDKSSHNRSRL